MTLLDYKDSRRLIFRELVSKGGFQLASWGESRHKKRKSSCAEECMQKSEIPINLLCTPLAPQKMWGFAGMSARQGISTPPLQVVM